MVIERAVARVDVFIEAIDGGAVTGYTAGSTSVTLHNFSHDSYSLWETWATARVITPTLQKNSEK